MLRPYNLRSGTHPCDQPPGAQIRSWLALAEAITFRWGEGSFDLEAGGFVSEMEFGQGELIGKPPHAV